MTLADNVVLVARDGSTIAIQDSAAPIQDRNGQIVGAVMVFHDVRQERQLHRRLAYLASHDPLTGFINRRELEERLSTVLGGRARPSLARRRRCSTWISTSSRSSTIRAGTAPATCCCGSSATCCGRACRRAARSRGSAATSSRCC